MREDFRSRVCQPLVLATDCKDYRAFRGRRIPWLAVVNHCRYRWRVIPTAVCRLAARQGAVSRYRQIPHLLVESFQGLRVLGNGTEC